MRIFLIENNDHTRDSLCAFLEELGHEVVSMQNGKEALYSFRQEPAPVVILDLHLVGFGSLDLLKAIKHEHQQTQIIATTSFPSLESVVDVMRLDALDYLVKTDDLFNTISDSLQRAEEHLQRTDQEKTEVDTLRSRVTELEDTNNLLALNICDPQTGLYNQNLFEETLSTEIERGKRNNRTFSIVLIRLNPELYVGEEKVEDRAIEGSLPTLAQTIRERLRKSDLLARYDNHTLSIILPETGREGATLVAESIAGLCVDLITSTMSEQVPEQSMLQVGVACFPDDGNDQTELLNKAGQATTTVGSDSIH